MSSLVKRYRSLFTGASIMYILPCSYSNRRNVFEISWPNYAALVLNFGFHCACLRLDWDAVNISIGTMSNVTLGVIIIYLVVYAMLLIAFVWNAFYHRDTFVHIFNALFAQDDWLLDWTAKKRIVTTINPATLHNGSIGLLILLAILDGFYIFVFTANSTYFRLYWLLLLRFCGMFLMVELYRACVIVLRERMQQLETLMLHTRQGVRMQVEHSVELFVERFQRYYELMECVNKCFAFPVIHLLLLILLERTVAAYDVYDNYHRLEGMSPWDTFGFVFRQIWQWMYLAIVFMVTISSTLTSIQVEETALCTRHFDDYRLQNTRAAKQIQKFLLKNLHQKKKFSACGFFDIDNTVIYMVFSSIVTYLVILIQFKQLETDLTQSPGSFNVTNNGTTVDP
uniref:Gustatory receptor n=1 Tax=Anopheles epiroticus TaxID=199890 RepID=A0A182P333_9DIPT